MRSLLKYWQLVTHLGIGWVWYRVVYAWTRKSGALRRATPMIPWDDVPGSLLVLHDCSAPHYARTEHLQEVVQEADRILAGEFRLFSFHRVVAGFPPDWHADQLACTRGGQSEGIEAEAKAREPGILGPVTGAVVKPIHWTLISDAGSKDIKGVWELSRFPWAFTLARAYAVSEDPRFCDGFWTLFSDWCDRNPPNVGHNWMCGQEATFRLMAVLFAVEVMGASKKQTLGVSRFVMATGNRIEANLNYALSQKNNHGVSECVGLISAALALPEYVRSSKWLKRGLKHLAAQLDELVYEDGSFSQHSLIYHRVLLHDLCWVSVRLTKAGHQVPDWLAAKAVRALDFLVAITDLETGEAPLFGSNDGANILPLSEAAYLDMRPTIQMVSAVFKSELPLGEGPWDEAAEWMVGKLTAIPRIDSREVSSIWRADDGGYAQISTNIDRIFIRCPKLFHQRPSQADMLHVDVWLNGKAVVQDGGSYSYNSPERFKDLSEARHHNGLTIDGAEPLRKFSRFLYLPWPKGGVELVGSGAENQCAIRVWNDAYHGSGVNWQREVDRNPGGGFTVIDKVTFPSARSRNLRWHWRLAGDGWILDEANGECRRQNDDVRISWKGIAGLNARLIRADSSTATGWWSPYYSEAEPCDALILDVTKSEAVELITSFTRAELGLAATSQPGSCS